MWVVAALVTLLALAIGAWLVPAVTGEGGGSLRFRPTVGADLIRPEPLEQRRYLLAVLSALSPEAR